MSRWFGEWASTKKVYSVIACDLKPGDKIKDGSGSWNEIIAITTVSGNRIMVRFAVGVVILHSDTVVDMQP